MYHRRVATGKRHSSALHHRWRSVDWDTGNQGKARCVPLSEIRRNEQTISSTHFENRSYLHLQCFKHFDRFIMNVKLFIVMGISWTFEVISYFINNYFQHLKWQDVFFYTGDILNCLQGLLIFILFVLKIRVYYALRKRLGLNTKGKPTPTCNATTTLQDPYKIVRGSTSSSTLMTTFAINSAKSGK